ncbi:unnamed protein product (macronuclear) [Paramecium tetraurelia]|uniref:Transmembrane protein n=1 Tax=Paramecium tetraurelia TaxID=5888 RepID=A0CPY9_PARTE|nr:uncharacterized protein GSPATT00038813001 [Paramecium tetraurelia]CAK72856.1 unnamed protein product [Paramecium tetraurelia]|eukprot:XP_001440253.1 hypothetical protein (macronuclear) [Paramecium tetraurelia strain d4-2]
MERYYYLSKFCYYINTSIIITFTTFCILLFIFNYLSYLIKNTFLYQNYLKIIILFLNQSLIEKQNAPLPFQNPCDEDRILRFYCQYLALSQCSQNQYYTGTSSGLISKASILYYYLIRDSQRSNPLPEYCLCISFSPYLQQARNQGKHNNVINTDLIRSEIYNNRDQDSTAQIPNRPLIVILFFRIEFKPILVSSGLEIPITNLCCCKVVKKLSWSCKMGYSFKSVSMNSHSFSFDEVE